MSKSLADRFAAHRKQVGKEQQEEDLEGATLSELSKERVSFGEAKNGQTFEQAFQDAQWTQFILRRFEKSQTTSHRRFIRFVELKLATSDGPSIPQGKKPSKAKETDTKEMCPPVETEDSEWEMDHLSTPVMEEMQDLRTANQQLTRRMANVETLMQEMMKALQNMSVKEEK